MPYIGRAKLFRSRIPAPQVTFACTKVRIKSENANRNAEINAN